MPVKRKPVKRKLTHEEIVEGFRALRKRVKPGSMSVREMVHEGRRLRTAKLIPQRRGHKTT